MSELVKCHENENRTRGTDEQRLNIVVTCTKRKRIRPGPRMWLRDIEAANLRDGFSEWLKRLEECAEEADLARNLYAGDHWSVVQSLEDTAHASGLDAKVWVCSAGYGLVRIDARVKAYSATFSLHHPDSMLRWNPTEAHSRKKESWWQLHQEWSGPEPTQPRSISGLAASDPESPMLIVASHDYLRAIGRDVKRALLELQIPDSLSIISTGTKRLPDLEANLLPSGAALQASVGGSMHSLNIRLARRILRECGAEELRASTLTSRLKHWLQLMPQTSRTVRRRLTDAEVQKYVVDSLTEDEHASWSLLLRRLRDSSRACRQERFVSIFRCEKSKLVGDN